MVRNRYLASAKLQKPRVQYDFDLKVDLEPANNIWK